MHSGATSTAVPLSRQLKEDLLSKITVHNTKGLKIWIADDSGLSVPMIGSMELPMDGYELLPQEGVSPRDWIQVPCTVMVPSSRMLVVDGLAEDTILLSTKGMKKNGIKNLPQR